MARTQRPTNIWLCSNGVHLQVTATRVEQLASAHWWWPLHRVSRSAMHAALPWPIHLDEFHFVGFHDRQHSLGIWVYVHTRTGAEIFVDGQGQTYRQSPLRDEPLRGRFTKCDVRSAAERAGLHLPGARAKTAAAGLPDDAGFDPGMHLLEPRVLTPGRRVDAMRRSRSLLSWDAQRPPRSDAETRSPSASARSGPTPDYIVVRPGPPLTHDFAERWEPRVIFTNPTVQASLDALEGKLLQDHPGPTSPGAHPPSPSPEEAAAGPSARQSHPSGGQAPHPSLGEASPKRPRQRMGASAPRLRQVWPPPTRPSRRSSY